MNDVPTLRESLGGVRTRATSTSSSPRSSAARASTRRAAAGTPRLLACADEIGVPDDPEFRSAFVGYLEWGTRLAVRSSQPGASVDEAAAMPRWGWGVVGGPYAPKPPG